MITHNIKQGTEEWHEFRANHFNASDAPAMMGVSPYKTRVELLTERITGIVKAVDDATQARFDEGHRLEKLAYPIAEGVVGEELYPAVGSVMKYAASFDGINADESIIFEHKTLSKRLESIEDGAIPEDIRVQIEHQLMVSGADKCLLMASREDSHGKLEYLHAWVIPDMDLSKKIIEGWGHFEKDLATYVVPAEAPVAIGESVEALPSVIVHVSGEVSVQGNFKPFEVALRHFLKHKLITAPETDQDFADLDKQIKMLKKAEASLKEAEALMLSQITSVDEAQRQKNMLYDLTRTNRIASEKLLEREKARRREVLAMEAKNKLSAYLEEARKRVGHFGLYNVDFSEPIKGLKTLKSIQDALDTTLVRGKILVDQKEEDVRIKTAWLKDRLKDVNYIDSYLEAFLDRMIKQDDQDISFEDYKDLVDAKLAKALEEMEVKMRVMRDTIRAEEEKKAKEYAIHQNEERKREIDRLLLEGQERFLSGSLEESAAQNSVATSQFVDDQLGRAKEEVESITDKLDAKIEGYRRRMPGRNAIIKTIALQYQASLEEAEWWLEQHFRESYCENKVEDET